MKSKLASAVVGMAFAIALLGATGASAATEAGNRCVGNKSTETFTVIGTANAPGDPLPPTIPVNGVITRWTFNIIPVPPGLVSQSMKILRPTGAPAQFQVVGETAPSPLVSGVNNFSARIPVRAGDFIGAFGVVEGEGEAVYCETGNAGERLGVIPGNPPLDSTATSAGEEAGFQVPIVVSIEPDADSDGFGDETQDQCPQSAAFQTACPPVSLSTAQQVRKGSVTIIVTTSAAAPVTVKGVVPLGKGKKANLNGGTQTLTPGTLGKFKLKFPKKVKTKLAELSRKQSLTLKATVKGTSITGAVTTKVLKIKLRGQSKP